MLRVDPEFLTNAKARIVRQMHRDET